jgi:hypothetical protein
MKAEGVVEMKARTARACLRCSGPKLNLAWDVWVWLDQSKARIALLFWGIVEILSRGAQRVF